MHIMFKIENKRTYAYLVFPTVRGLQTIEKLRIK